jgi:hypothetical protein
VKRRRQRLQRLRVARVPRLRERLLRVRRAEMRGLREEQMRSRKGEGTEGDQLRREETKESQFHLQFFFVCAVVVSSLPFPPALCS